MKRLCVNAIVIVLFLVLLIVPILTRAHGCYELGKIEGAHVEYVIISGYDKIWESGEMKLKDYH